jgi:hypothetical protein
VKFTNESILLFSSPRICDDSTCEIKFHLLDLLEEPISMTTDQEINVFVSAGNSQGFAIESDVTNFSEPISFP